MSLFDWRHDILNLESDDWRHNILNLESHDILNLESAENLEGTVSESSVNIKAE